MEGSLENKNKLGARIKLLMESKGISTNELGKKADLNGATIRKIIIGQEKNPKANTLLKICQILECSLDELYDIKSKSQPWESVYKDQELDLELYAKCVNTIATCLSAYSADGTNGTANGANCKLTLSTATMLASKLYAFSLNKKDKQVDDAFAQWLIEENLQVRAIPSK